jgi:hypothetical protein
MWMEKTLSGKDVLGINQTSDRGLPLGAYNGEDENIP